MLPLTPLKLGYTVANKNTPPRLVESRVIRNSGKMQMAIGVGSMTSTAVSDCGARMGGHAADGLAQPQQGVLGSRRLWIIL